MPTKRLVDPKRPERGWRVDGKKTITLTDTHTGRPVIDADTGKPAKKQLTFTITRDTEDEADEVYHLMALDLAAKPWRNPYERYEQAAAEEARAAVGAAAVAATTTVGVWMDDWVPKRRVAESTAVNQKWMLDRIRDRWAEEPLDDEHLIRDDVQNWIWDLHDDFSSNTCRNIGRLFAQIIRHAILSPKQPQMTRDPYIAIDYDPMPSTGRYALTPEDAGRFIAHLTSCEEAAWALLGCGARLAELTRRTQPDWDPRGKRIRIPPLPRSSKRPADRPVPEQAGRPQRRTRKVAAKNDESVRWIYFCDGAAAYLADYFGSHGRQALFLNNWGTPAKTKTVEEAFVRASERAGLDYHITPHWFRHLVDSWLARHHQRVHRRARDELLGHVTPGMDAIYVHVDATMRAEREAVMQELWDRARVAYHVERARIEADLAAVNARIEAGRAAVAGGRSGPGGLIPRRRRAPMCAPEPRIEAMS